MEFPVKIWYFEHLHIHKNAQAVSATTRFSKSLFWCLILDPALVRNAGISTPTLTHHPSIY